MEERDRERERDTSIVNQIYRVLYTWPYTRLRWPVNRADVRIRLNRDSFVWDKDLETISWSDSHRSEKRICNPLQTQQPTIREYKPALHQESQNSVFEVAPWVGPKSKPLEIRLLYSQKNEIFVVIFSYCCRLTFRIRWVGEDQVPKEVFNVHLLSDGIDTDQVAAEFSAVFLGCVIGRRSIVGSIARSIATATGVWHPTRPTTRQPFCRYVRRLTPRSRH